MNSVKSESDKSLRHEFKDLACYLCLAGAVVASQSLTQEIAGSNNLFSNKIFLSVNLANSLKTCRKNSNAIDLRFVRFQGCPCQIHMKEGSGIRLN